MPLRYRELHRALCGAPESSWQHSDVFITLDRGASPSGERRIKDLRCQGRAHGGVWPSPGVFSVPALAKRILTHAAQRRIKALSWEKAPLSDAEKVRALLRGEAARSGNAASPLMAWARLRGIKPLFPLGLTLEDAIEALTKIQPESAPELVDWAQRLASYLDVVAASEGRSMGPWSEVAEACAILEDEALASRLDFLDITERQPFCPPRSLRFSVLAYKEAHPLERQFLRELAKFFPVEWLEPQSDETWSLADLSALPLAKAQRNSAGIYWAHTDALPRASECLERLGAPFPLDVESEDAKAPTPLYQALRLRAELSPLFEADARHAELLTREGWDESSALDFPTLVGELAKRDLLSEGDARALLELHEEVPQERLGEWLQIFENWGCFENKDGEEWDKPADSRLSARGVPLLSVEDLPLGGHAQCLLWSTRADLVQLLDPLRSDNLKRAPFPPHVAGVFEALGYAVPDAARETRLQAALFSELKDSLYILEAPERTRWEKVESRFTAPQLSRRWSPSDIDAWTKCPLSFYLSRVMRAQEGREWDAENPSAMDTGSWVHEAIARFLVAGDWNSVLPSLRQCLEETLPSYFQGQASQQYRGLLEGQAQLLAEKLSLHVEFFEKPLRALLPLWPPAVEMKISGELFGQSFGGKPDRLDSIPGGKALLWDYKTGGSFDSPPLTLIRKGHAQYFLYQQLLRTMGHDVLLGGYVNPLRPERSVIFVEEHAPAEWVAWADSVSSRYPVRKISEHDRVSVDMLVEENMHRMTQELGQGIVAARPEDPNNCPQCEHRGLCGRPYLAETEGT